MLTDAALKNLRPKSKTYKCTDRDGLYVCVSPGGGISFRYDYRFSGRRETVTLGVYGPAGLSLAKAREKLIDAKRLIAEGVSPALEKQRAKRRLKEAHSFAHVAQGWMDKAPMADSTRNMRRSIFNREVLPHWRSRLLSEITPDDIRAHCKTIVDRGAPATAIHVRDIVKQIYAYAILHGEKIDNPADGVGPASIATFRPRDRSLSPTEIRIMLGLLGDVATLPTIRLGLKFVLLSMVRKSELQDGIWTEVDFEGAVWSIPKERMKRSRPHNVYLSAQMLDILIALKTCAGNSRYILPSRYDADAPMSRATFNRVTTAIAERARDKGLPLEPFTVHDLRRTASKAWFRGQNEQGRLVREVRSSPLFAKAMRWVASALEWLTGRGAIRGLTFIFIAAIVVFLATLPMDQLTSANGRYEAARAQVRDLRPTPEILATLCQSENALAQVEQRTGLALMTVPDGFTPYPFDDQVKERWKSVQVSDRAIFLAHALLDGRVLTDDATAVPKATIESGYQRYLFSMSVKKGRLTGNSTSLLPKSLQSQAIADDIRAFCDSDPTTGSKALTAVRSRADYDGIFERTRARALAFLEHPAVREAYNEWQTQTAISRFCVAFFHALGAGFILWASVKAAIVLCRLTNRRIWLIANYAVIALSAPAIFLVAALLTTSTAVVNAVAPLAIGLAAASARHARGGCDFTPAAHSGSGDPAGAALGAPLDGCETDQ